MKWLFVLLQAVDSLKVELVKFCLFVYEFQIYLLACMESRSWKNSFVTEEVFLSYCFVSQVKTAWPEETLRAQTQFLRGLET